MNNKSHFNVLTLLVMSIGFSSTNLIAAENPKEKAVEFFLRGDTKNQLIELDKQLAKHPNDIGALFNRANALLELKRFEDALNTYSKIISLDPNSAIAWRQRADVYFETGRYKNCLDDCKQSLSMVPDDPVANELSSRANQRLGQTDAAIDDLTKAIDHKTAPVHELIQRAKLYRTIGKYQSSIDDCTRVRKMDWSSDEALEERAKNYELIGRADLANDDLEELRYQRAHTVRYSVGGPTRVYVDSNTGKWSFNSIPAKKPTKPPPAKQAGASDKVPDGLSQLEYYHLARTYGGRLPKQALECIIRAEKMDSSPAVVGKAHQLRDTMLPKQIPPDEAIILNRQAFYWLSDASKCLEVASECIRRFPSFEYGYITLGSLEKDRSNRAAAEENFRKALEINPHNTETLSRLGDVLRWHDVPEAKRVLQQAVKYDPDDTLSGYLLELYKFDQ